MKILIVWRDIPSPLHPSLARPFYFLKYIKNCEITLISFFTDKAYKGDVYRYCNKFEGVKIPVLERNALKLLYSLKSRFSYKNILFSRDFNIFRAIYFPKMKERIVDLLKSNKFDIVYADYMVYPYLFSTNVFEPPIILEFFSPRLYSLRQLYLHEKVLSRKLRFLMEYYSLKLFEAPRYKKFDAGIYVSTTHKVLSKQFLPKKSFIIPPGVDLEYFKSISDLSRYPSLVFTGSMNHPVNIQSVLGFCNKIYPAIKKEIRDIKFYIIGRSPCEEIKKLSLKDNSIVVTGEVEDVRPYISKAHVVVAPIILDDGGIKTKVLEAMAMGKVVVSTSMGAQEIGALHGKNIILADNPRNFAEYVISLIQDGGSRKKIENNARRFIEKNYSWKGLTNVLNKDFERLSTDH